MADVAASNGKKKRKAQGPRKVKPLYAVFNGPQAPEILGVTREPFELLVKANSENRQVSFVDLNTFLPQKAAKPVNPA
jgi:hypothetical protein